MQLKTVLIEGEVSIQKQVLLQPILRIESNPMIQEVKDHHSGDAGTVQKAEDLISWDGVYSPAPTFALFSRSCPKQLFLIRRTQVSLRDRNSDNTTDFTQELEQLFSTQCAKFFNNGLRKCNLSSNVTGREEKSFGAKQVFVAKPMAIAAPAAFKPLSGTLIFLILETWAGRVGRDFRRGDPMVVQEALAMETIVDWRMTVSF
ncbi:hypothetical protein TNCV_2673341 [Trichonephila clavipes]|nr:hypothetical protein TNCV_2673341 [Trichonephila clavipes]